eukprot:3936264-Rhodomonas_salina.1
MYYFRLAMVNSVGTGPFSAAVSSTPDATTVNAEAGAVGHWLLGDDNTNHADLVSGRQATPLNTAPVLYGGYLRTAAGLHGLRTGLTLTNEFTMCFTAHALGTASAQMLGGNFGGASTDTKAGIWWGVTMAAGATPALSPSISGVAVDLLSDFHFAALSISLAGGGVTLFIGNQGGSTVVSQAFSGAYVPGTDILGIGNLYFGGFNSIGMDYAEAIFFESALDQTQMEAVYQRSVTRLTARGVTVA